MFVNELHQGGINALLAYDSTIFDNMVLPSGISLDEVVDNIVLKYGDTPLMIPAPEIMKFYIGRWSSKRIAQWNRFKVAIEKQYNPIENYNRTEKRTSTTDYGHNITSGESITHGHKVKTDDDLTRDLTTENQISADNASTYQADRMEINGGRDQRDLTEQHSGVDSSTGSETHSGKDSETIDSQISGNIGVTTSQQMLTSELDLIPRLNLIDYITEDFHQEFCLSIY